MQIAIGGGSFLVSQADWETEKTLRLTKNLLWTGRPCDVTWRLSVKSHTSYVVHTVGAKIQLRLHRLLIEANPNQIVDHINGDGTDNRRENLRVTDHSGNARNRGKYHDTASRFKGVGRASPNRWAAWIRINGKKKHLGCYASEIDAAIAYNNAASAAFGEFARLNVV